MTPYSWLEPYAGKLASTVLKGKGGGDPAGLPGDRTTRYFLPMLMVCGITGFLLNIGWWFDL